MPMWIDHGRGALLTDVDGNTFIDFAGGIGCLNIGHAHPRVVAGRAGRRRAVPAHRLHDRARTRRTSSSPSGCCRSCRSPATSARRSSTRAPRRSRTPSRSRRPPPGAPAVIAYEGAFHGRTHDGDVADLEGAPVQGGLRAVRARGLPRRRSRTSYRLGPDAAEIALRRPAPGAQDARRTRVRGRDHHRAGAGRGRLRAGQRRRTCAACARSATSTASC